MADNRNIMAEEVFNGRVRKFTQFLDGQDQMEKVRKIMSAGERRLLVSVDDLRQFDREYCNGILKEPIDFIPPFEKALKEIALTVDQRALSRADLERAEFHVGLEGAFGDHYVNPRTLSAKHLGKSVMIEGIVTRCSLVRPKVVKSVHYCEATQLFHQREYRDYTALGTVIPTPAVYPKEDDKGNPLSTEFGFCTYRDYQTVSIQEMPERAPAGQLPRPLDVILDDDLVDKCKPGDRVCIVGVYRSIGKGGGSISSTFRTVILSNSIRLINREVLQPNITEQDLREIRKLAKREDIFELLSNSLAPSIFNTNNMKYIKKAVLMQLLGGMEKNLENGTHIRGDINLLLVGDPSTAKSQMLRFVYKTAPLAVTTTGRGSSGVGLTAAVTTDKETGERRLEAGAMVLADRGIVCIDEFDKMSDNDRVAIHEVMEQQTVTIAKAGIHTTLNARCSVIAAANPAYGQYIDRRRPFENIALPDSLLSRFDLLFIVCDEVDEEYDKMISEHVLRMHRYQPPDLEEGTPINENFAATMSSALAAALRPDEEEDSSPFERFNKLLHTNGEEPKKKSGRKSKTPKSSILKLAFIKKYIHYAKSRIKPVLTQEAAEFIAGVYADLRNKKLEEENNHMEKTLPVTARMLETLIRLSTAHAKARLSKEVTKEDADVAKELLEFVLYKEVKDSVRKTKKRRVVEDEGEEAESDSDDEEDDDEGNKDTSSREKRVTRGKTLAPGVDDAVNDMARLGFEDEDDEEMDVDGESRRKASRGRKSSSTAYATSQAHLSDLIETSSSQKKTSSATGLTSEFTRDDVAAAMEVDNVSPARLEKLRARLNDLRNGQPDVDFFTLKEAYAFTNGGLGTQERFDQPEFRSALKSMEDSNQIMVTEDDEPQIVFI